MEKDAQIDVTPDLVNKLRDLAWNNGERCLDGCNSRLGKFHSKVEMRTLGLEPKTLGQGQ